MFIYGRGKEEYLIEEIPILKKNDLGNKKWKAENHQIVSWLIDLMNVDIGENFLLHEIAQEIWEAARETFTIELIFHDLRHGDLIVMQYFKTLTHHV